MALMYLLNYFKFTCREIGDRYFLYNPSKRLIFTFANRGELTEYLEELFYQLD